MKNCGRNNIVGKIYQKLKIREKPNNNHFLTFIIVIILLIIKGSLFMKWIDQNYFDAVDKNSIKHAGVISKITGSIITVSLEGNMNCEACNAKAACGVSESNSKDINVASTGKAFQLNEGVDVVLQKEIGLKAVFWAYIFPFILVIVVLIFSSIFLKEWIAGLLSLFVLIPYYITLHFFNNSFEKTFKISILKSKER
jgi:sigma-E factor negative regulatory protein RseC